MQMFKRELLKLLVIWFLQRKMLKANVTLIIILNVLGYCTPLLLFLGLRVRRRLKVTAVDLLLRSEQSVEFP